MSTTKKEEKSATIEEKKVLSSIEQMEKEQEEAKHNDINSLTIVEESEPTPDKGFKRNSDSFEVDHTDKAAVRKILEIHGATYIYDTVVEEDASTKVTYTVKNLDEYEKFLKTVNTYNRK